MPSFSVGHNTAKLIETLKVEMTQDAGWEPTNAQVIRYGVECALEKLNPQTIPQEDNENAATAPTGK